MAKNRSTAVMQRRVEAHDSLDVISRAEAIALGQRWYFTGVSCPRGHIAKRSVSNRDCRKCADTRRSERDAVDPQRAKARNWRRYHKDSEAGRRKSKENRDKNIEARRAADRERYRKNADRYKAAALKWARKNKGKRAAIIAARRMKQRHATPPWLTDHQKRQIRDLYIAAAGRDGEWQVDHIVPINGDDICGLHVPWNLQIITGDENRHKGNRYAAE